jgi:hypothetical protein
MDGSRAYGAFKNGPEPAQNRSEGGSMKPQAWLKLPVELGRMDDPLSPLERTIAVALAGLEASRLKLVCQEAIELSLLAAELEAALRETER